MVSKNNQWQHLQASAQRVPHYGLRKLSVGVASVLLSTTLYMGATAHADTVAETDPQPTIDQSKGAVVDTSTVYTAANVHTQSTADQPASAAANSSVSENDANTKSASVADVSNQPANVGDAQSVLAMNVTQPAAASNSAAPTSEVNADSVPAMLSKQPANTVDTQSTAAANHVLPFMNLAVASTNEDLTPKRETVDSKWTLHYVNQADHQQELKDPTVITMQYTRTNTPLSDGTVQYGDWSYVPGSFKQTGTQITVDNSDNPVKEDNVGDNGKNEDVFTVTAWHPAIAGYTIHGNITHTNLRTHLLNYDATGKIQAPVINDEFDVEYDTVSGERSINVKFVDDQSFDFETIDHKKQVGQAVTLTGRDGDTVNLNLTVPDKYQLADGQQLPTTFTFTKGSGDVTIHLKHQIAQREAAIDVQVGLVTLVTFGDDEDEPAIVVTQNQWRQLDDEIKKHALVNDLEEVDPTVEVGTLTGHVNYDLVDEKVVSFADDWTSLNLGGQTYQMPDGTDVVNGIIVGTDLSWGEKLKEHFLNYIDDPDYATYSWHGYLSVNKSNIDADYAGFRLVGNEPNALAKATDDRAATTIEMTNKPIDLSLLRESIMGGGLSDFNEQDGQLRAKAIVPVGGMYIPYVEKTATRTINVTTPDGKTTTVKQTATLEKQVIFNKDTHPDWTTGEWTSYDVPVIPGYTSSQSSVAKKAVTGATRDQTVNITYTANPQTMTVVYQTEDGTPVHTTTINGQIDQTVEVPSEVPVGWMIIKGEVPSEITFGANGHEPIEVTVSHRHVTVTPDQPQDNGTKLPDNPAKTFTGVEANDLNKTIVRTIKVTIPDGKATTTKQEAKLTRTADADEVTGEVKYGTWSTGQWDAYEIPSVKGYTASQSNVAVTSVNENTKDQTVEISYTPNKQTTMIKYIDGKGQVVHTTTVDGVTNQTVKVASEVPAGWMIIEGKVPDEITFGVNGHEPINVTIDHQHVMVTPDQPKISTDKLPDNSTKTYPNGVGHDDLNKTVTRTIKVTTLDGQTKVATQTAKLTRAADVDEVTGEVTYGKWTTGEWSNYEVPAVPGYTPSQSEVPAAKVTDDTKDQTVSVTYTANGQATHINYVDGDGKIVLTTTVTGKTGQTVKVPNEVPTGWTVTGGQVPREVTFGPEGYDNVTVTVDHRHVTVTSDQPQADGTKLPDNSTQTFHGVAETDLSKSVIRTIKIMTPAGKTDTITQTAKLTRTADVDEVTGEVTYGAWSTGKWDAYQVPALHGYTASQTTVAATSVTGETASQTVKITYSADRGTVDITYVDEAGQPVYTTTVTGTTGETVMVPKEVPAGWLITQGEVPTTVTMTGDKMQTITVTVQHRTVTVEPTQPQSDGTPLPDNPSQHFTGVATGDLNKPITRTIVFKVPGQDSQTVTQTATLTRTATVDEVTGDVTYGDWTTAQWPSLIVPVVDGCTASQAQVPEATVGSMTDNQMVSVAYQAVEVPTTPTTSTPTTKARPTMTPTTTSATRVTVTSASSKTRSMATSAAQPTASAAKATELPQTGDDKVVSASTASLGLLLSSLSAYVLGRKRKGKGHKV